MCLIKARKGAEEVEEKTVEAAVGLVEVVAQRGFLEKGEPTVR
jgi:hypothetical protein